MAIPTNSPASTPPDNDIIDLPAELVGGPVARRNALTVVRDPFEHFLKLSAVSKQLTKAAILETKGQDWIAMGDKVYLQATGGERLQRLGALVMEEPAVVREDYPDGSFAYVATGRMYSKLFDTVIAVEGARWSGEEFFDRFAARFPAEWKDMDKAQRLEWKQKNRLPVAPTDVRKAAHTNWRIRGISMMFGLRNLTAEDLHGFGLDVSKVGRIEFQSGGQGGKARVMSSSGGRMSPDKFGPQAARGKPISQISDEHLLWYVKAAQTALADPAKSQYHAKEQAALDDYLLELDSRRKDKQATPDGAPDPDGSYTG